MSDLAPWRAIIFDFDGVLVDSVNVKTEAFRSLYKDYGAEIQDAVVGFHLEHGGLSRFEKIRHYETTLLDRQPSEADIEGLANLFAQKVKDSVIAANEITGASTLLAALEGVIPMFVASGTPEIELIEIVERRGWASYFDDVRGSPTHKTTLVQEIILNRKFEPGDCVMIGDAMTDYAAARDNGLQFIGITDENGQHSFPSGTKVYDNLAPLIEMPA